ncbi:hypothetical protein HMSSN036_03050 [Paenibacillus macerans]|nr:hypothetical protein HMSSN036_03050 [Paenibacillus macerans]
MGRCRNAGAQRFFEQIIQEFEQQNPDIEVDYLGVPGDLSAYEQKVNVAISAGQRPIL